MSSWKHSQRWIVFGMALLLAGGVALAEMKQATIVVAKKAQSKGEVVFSLTPTGGEEVQVPITVVEKMSPGDVAAAIAKEFSYNLSESYKIKQSGAKVTVKPLTKKATFELKIANQTVEGISITIK